MKKGFTLVELLGVIAVLGIIASLAVAAVVYIVDNGKRSVYVNYEKTLKSEAEHYLIENFEAIPNVGSTLTLYYTELKKGNLEDPNGGYCNNADSSKDSYIIITRNADKGNNYDFDYKVCLRCSSYQSKDC